MDTTGHQRIRELRKSLKLTQIEISEALGDSQGWYSDVERGKKPPSYNLLIKFSEIFNASTDWIISGIGEMIITDSDTPTHNPPPQNPQEKYITETGNTSSRNEKSTILAVDADTEPKELTEINALPTMTTEYNLQKKEEIIRALRGQIAFKNAEIQSLTELLQAYQMEDMKAEKGSKSSQYIHRRNVG